MDKVLDYKKMYVYKFILLLFITVFSTTSISAKKVDVTTTRYEIEGVETGSEGTYLVKVYVFTDKPEATAEQLKYAAVHGVLFKGFAGKGFAAQKAMVNRDVEITKADFFKAFWNNNDYLAYATIINDVADRIKISKKEYKLAAIVSVSKDELRKLLEDSGIIRGLNTGF